MRLHTTSRGLDPTRLEPGADIVLELDEAHGIAVADGVLAHDHLSMADRRAVDAAVTENVLAWTRLAGPALTVDGIDLAWIWEADLITKVFMPLITDALALDRAIERYSPAELTVVDRDPATETLARVIAERRGVTVVLEGGEPAPADEEEAHPPPPHVRLRRRLVRALLGLGVPSRLRKGSVLMLAYWPLMPLLDRMLAEGDRRPAVWLSKLPAGPRRSLQAASRGGWLGTPGPRTRASARRRARRAIQAAERLESPLEPLGLPLGGLLHDRSLALGRSRAAADVALALLFERALERRRLARVLVPYDIEPQMRLLVFLARRAGVPTLLVAHGAYPLRHTIVDMQVSDAVALWSSTFGPTVWRFDRALHVVGYPLPHEIGAAKPPPSAVPQPRVLVLGHGKETQTSLFDDRFAMRQYSAAVKAVAATLPSARVVLRPHPSESVSAVKAFAGQAHGVPVEVDRGSDLATALDKSDACIGTPSTVTFQAALAGVPVVVLNLSGYDWCWPLGGVTNVPIARSEEELATFLEAWAAGRELPGRSELMAAIGAHGEDATERLLELI